MKISAALPLAAFFDGLQDAPAAARLRRVLVDETNVVIDEADRRIAIGGASPSLRRARDTAARSALEASDAVVVLEMRGIRVSFVEMALAGQTELEQALANDALRAFRRAPRQPSDADVPRATHQGDGRMRAAAERGQA